MDAGHGTKPATRTAIRAGTRAFVLVALVAASLPALAQYKVIGPDGSVTYTDRPPTQGRVVPVNPRGPSVVSSGTGDTALPADLRQPVARYPVTLYTIVGACDPCAVARQLLRTRGVPFSEKQVSSSEDAEALERLTGSRDAPTLAIGSQTLRGFAPEVWSSYLDAAGYPRESRLPPGYAYAAATPIVARREAVTTRTPATSEAAGAPTAPSPVPAPGTGAIRF